MQKLDDFASFRSFIEHIEGIIESYESKIEILESDLDVINYGKQRIEKSLNAGNKIDPNKLMDDLKYVSEILHDDFDLDNFSRVFAMYHTFPNNSEFSKKYFEMIDETTNAINKYISSKKFELDRIIKINNTYKICYELLVGLLPENDKHVPVDSEEKLRNIFAIIANNSSMGEENIILMQFNKLNLEALKERDLRLEKQKIELEKLKVRKSLIEKAKKVKISSPKTVVDKLSDEDKKVIEEAQKVLEENKELCEAGYSDEIMAGVDIAQENDATFNYDIDMEIKVNLNIIVAHIEKLLSETPVNFEKLKNAVNYYKTLSASLSKEVNDILEFEQTNAEELELVKLAIEEYNKMFQKLSKKPKAFEIIESIDIHKIDLDLTSSIDLENLEKFISDIGFDLGINFYLKFKALESIKKIYEDYLVKDNLEAKQNEFDVLSLALEEYKNLTFLDSDTLDETIDNTNSNNAQNELLYLILDDGTNPVRDFISKQNFDEGNFETLERAFNDLKGKDFQYLYLNSTKLIQRCRYRQKTRRHRYNDIRVIYIRLNTIGNISLPKDKVYYLVYTAGLKHGEKDLFDFAASPHVQNAITKFFKPLKNVMEQIDALKISDEEKNSKKEEYMNEFVRNNNQLFIESINSLRGTLESGSGGRK